jgi:hypothetical protein
MSHQLSEANFSSYTFTRILYLSFSFLLFFHRFYLGLGFPNTFNRGYPFVLFIIVLLLSTST